MPQSIRSITTTTLLALILWPIAHIHAAPIALSLQQNQLSTADGLSFWTVELDFGSQALESGVVSLSQRFEFISDQLVVQDLGVVLPYQEAARQDLLQRHASTHAQLVQKLGRYEAGVAELAILQARGPQIEQSLTESRAQITASTVAITNAQNSRQLAIVRANVLAVQKGILEDERNSVLDKIAEGVNFLGDLLEELLRKAEDLADQIASVVQQQSEVTSQITQANSDEQTATEAKEQWTATGVEYENALSNLDIEIAQKQDEIARLNLEKARLTTLLSVIVQQVQAFPANTVVEGFALTLNSLNGQPLNLPFYGALQLDVEPALPYCLFFDGRFTNGHSSVGRYANITDGTSLISSFTLDLDVPFDPEALQSGPVFDRLTLTLIASNISFLSQTAPGPVPEPQAWILLSGAILFSMRLRRRRNTISLGE